jgi:hypothetical protein
MHAILKRWGFVAVFVAILVGAILITKRHPPATASGIEMLLVGYTNAPSNNGHFALFCITNHAGYSVRWWGDWVEVEGSSERKAKIVNPALPGFTRAPVLKAGESLKLAVGDPFTGPETGRWRFSMSCSRYSIRVRWLDFSFHHRLPMKLGPIVLVDDQRILNPTNHVTVSSQWLTH